MGMTSLHLKLKDNVHNKDKRITSQNDQTFNIDYA